MADEESIATKKEKRLNAGARMSRLLEDEDEDDFYKTTYGGFTEEADDEDYQSEASDSDVADSDIDIDENDELKSDAENENEAKEKKKSVYKDPKKTVKAEQVPQQKIPKLEKPSPLDIVWEKKSIRKSTVEKSKCTEGLLKEREARAALVKMSGEKKKTAEYRRLTQEELLAEAKVTEEINLASLETYQKMELERKKVRSHRTFNSGPSIKYHSITAPLDYYGDITVDTISSIRSEVKELPSFEKCSRNFITFTDDELCEKNFPSPYPPEPVQKQFCAVTGLPAKYLDPVTQLPYATLEAFKILREAYKQKMLPDKIDAESRKRPRQSVP